jgi:hypothetical protein
MSLLLAQRFLRQFLQIIQTIKNHELHMKRDCLLGQQISLEICQEDDEQVLVLAADIVRAGCVQQLAHKLGPQKIYNKTNQTSFHRITQGNHT